DIMFNEGISASGDLLDLAVTEGIVAKSGSWFSFGDMRLGQGRENSKTLLRENPDLFAEIKQSVLEKKGIANKPTVPEETPAKAETAEA
ncbi:MAG: recombinase RecA, partial [Phycisphaeraceae bacterium]